jgi:autotransporter-associated beta strand protein
VYAFLLAAAPLAAQAQTTFFSDNFTHGSTTNGLSIPGGTPTASSTSYDFASSKNCTASTIGANLLHCVLNSATTSGYWEAQALFAMPSNAVSLNAPGDYIELAIVFTNSLGTLANGVSSELWVGLYNSGAGPGATNPPVAGSLANAGLTTTSGSAYATGNCQPWAGYACKIFSGAGSRVNTRPVQNGAGSSSANQELLGANVSGGTYNNPGASTLATGTSQTFTLATNIAHTLTLRITLDPAGSGNLIISNAISNASGLVLTNATSTATVLATAFDGLAFGALNKTGSANPGMDVASISITGISSPPVPPVLNCQPANALVTTGGSCAFSVCATGNALTYRWHRNGTNLVNGGNISGATSSMLVISSASAADVLSGANGYYATVTGAGDLSTNSTTASLSLVAATNLIWSAGSSIWDVATNASWQDAAGHTGLAFTFGDAVTFDDVGGGGMVTLASPYLSAASVTVNHSSAFYTFGGSGSFAGPGKLLYTGAGLLTISNANTYTGGTLISNATANLRLANLNGLGNGPITLAQAGGQIEIIPTASSGTGINADWNVADDFTLVVDSVNNAFGVVLNGNLSGTAGKTLTINHGSAGSGTNQTRIRVSGISTVFDANLALNDSTFLWACYQGSGSHTYNGVISGTGAYMQKSATTYLNGLNTYSGGTTPASGTIGLGIDSVGNPVTSGPIGTGPLYLLNDSTTSLTGSGTILAWGGPRTIANLIQCPTGSNNLTLIIGGTNTLTLSGAFSLQGNDGGGAGTNRIIQTDNTGLSTISGVISDGGVGAGLTKTGTNVLALTAANTYAGPTTVSAGTLQVNGQLGAGAVNVGTNATLAGTGTIGGSVTVSNGAAIAPGTTGIGTLTINGGLTIAGNMRVDVDATGSTSDKLSVAGTLANTGTGIVTVNNVGGALPAGTTFTLFNKPLTNGNLMTVMGAGANWTNKLAVDGTIEVLSAIPTTGTNISYSFSGGTLTLSWPANYLGWTLQSNAVSVTSATNWFDVPNSTAVTSIALPVNPARASVFFRMSRQLP